MLTRTFRNRSDVVCIVLVWSAFITPARNLPKVDWNRSYCPRQSSVLISKSLTSVVLLYCNLHHVLDTCNLPRLKRIATIDLRFCFLYMDIWRSQFPVSRKCLLCHFKAPFIHCLTIKGRTWLEDSCSGGVLVFWFSYASALSLWRHDLSMAGS